MPLISKTVVSALAITGAVASLDNQFSRREYNDALIARLQARTERQIGNALVARSYDDHLDDLYPKDISARDLEIRSDLDAALADADGLYTRDIDAADAMLRVRELADRDQELLELYARELELDNAEAGDMSRLETRTKLGEIFSFFRGVHHHDQRKDGEQALQNQQNQPPAARKRRRSLEFEDPEMFW